MKSEKQKDNNTINTVIVRRCDLADKEHNISKRQYAHTHHIKGSVICVAGAWVMLPFETEMGLIAHEVGHLLAGNTNHSEGEADRLADRFFKVTIIYKNTVYGDRLQYLSHKDSMKVYIWVLDNVKFEGRLFT
jgi:hypothetical protein